MKNSRVRFEMSSLQFVVLLFLMISNGLHETDGQGLYEGNSCRLNDGTRGICENLQTCAWAKEALNSRRLTIKDLVRCGFVGNALIICCGDERPSARPPTRRPEPVNNEFFFTPDTSSVPSSTVAFENLPLPTDKIYFDENLNTVSRTTASFNNALETTHRNRTTPSDTLLFDNFFTASTTNKPAPRTTPSVITFFTTPIANKPTLPNTFLFNDFLTTTTTNKPAPRTTPSRITSFTTPIANKSTPPNTFSFNNFFSATTTNKPAPRTTPSINYPISGTSTPTARGGLLSTLTKSFPAPLSKATSDLTSVAEAKIDAALRLVFGETVQPITTPRGRRIEEDDDNDISQVSTSAPVMPTTAKIPSRIVSRKSERACTDFTAKKPQRLDFHIIMGEETGVGEFPHMAAIGYPGADDALQIDWRCGGTLISDLFVLTAAHCIRGRDLKPTMVRLGATNLFLNDSENPTRDFGIEQLISHPDYVSNMNYHDIALLRLNERVIFSDTIYPACMHLHTAELLPNVEVVVTGWGIVNITTNARSTGLLLKASLSSVPLSECRATYLTAQTVARRLPNGLNMGHMCANDPAGQRDACQGDSGGPLQFRGGDSPGTVLGVTSFGSSCGNSNFPGVYARVAFYLDWIESVIWPNEYQ